MKTGDQMHIAYPYAVHYKEKGGNNSTKGKTAINQLLWGDWARIEKIEGNWVRIRSRNRSGWVRHENLQPNRILEVNFVDIGQGDGCHIQTPGDKAIILDAGEEDNMYRFLRWRFGRFERKFTFESFLASHPDMDHYYGFRYLLEDENVHVETFYHNTIVEQVLGGESALGTEKKIDGKKYLTGLVRNREELEKITSNRARRGGRYYPNMLKEAMDTGRVGEFTGLLAGMDFGEPRYLPGYAPEDNRGLTFRILGPVPRDIGHGKPGLPWLGSTGKTKNGHSVVLLLEIGHVRILLGGDLNERAHEYLLNHYTGLDPEPKTPSKLKELVEAGKKVFEVDIAKACHHGSADVLPAFLAATNTLVTVVSSGDNEPHSHPRPDTLGMIGKYGRSDRPMIFSTELARTGSEEIKHPNVVRRELRQVIDLETAILNDPNASAAEKQAADKRLEDHLQVIQRSVANYGMINVLTDGDKVVIAQRLEKERSKSQRWDLYRFETDSHGRLHYVD